MAFKPQPATVTQRKLTMQPTGASVKAQKCGILHLQNHLMLHLLVQRLGTGWLGKSPAGREGGRPRVAVPGWMPPSRGDTLHSGVGAAACPAERGMPLRPAAWSWEGHTVSSWGRPHLRRLPRSRRTLRNWGETHEKLPELCDLQGETQAC